MSFGVAPPQHHADNDVGVAVTDRYTHHLLTFLETINKTSSVTMQNLVRLATSRAISHGSI